MGQDQNRITKLTWVYISGVIFVLFLILSVFLIIYADRLGQFGITKSFYYIVLIPVGLCAAGFLFGAMHSHARYVGKTSYGQLELTGPVVLFCLVVIGGFYFAEPDSTFLLTIRLNPNDNKIIKSGSLILDLDNQRIKRDIGENGEVLFAGLPSGFIGKEINIIPEVEGFKSKEIKQKIPSNKVIYVELTPEDYRTKVRGTVIDKKGNPLKGVKINFGSGLAVCESDESGDFLITLPVKEGAPLLVTASLNGKTGFRELVAILSVGSITIPFNINSND